MTETTSSRKINPEPGSLVIASDGKEIGPVKEVAGEYVKIAKRFGRDYWLSFEEILTADAEKTLLIIPSDEINLYKLSKPSAGEREHVGDRPHSADWLDREMMRR